MKRLLLDEMYTGLKPHFEILGYDVETVQDADLKGAEDRRIVEYARDHGLLLVTPDQKAAELAELAGVKYVLVHSNILIVRWVDARLKGLEIQRARDRGPDIAIFIYFS